MNQKNKGTIYILISALFFGSYGVWSRLMSPSFSEFNQAWTRGLLLLILVAVYALITKKFKPILKKDLPWFIAIAIAGGLNQAPYFYGFEHLRVGTATLLFYASLVFGGYLIGKVIFSEKLTNLKYLSLLISLLGMATIYRFSLTPDQFLPATATIIAGLMGAVSAVLPKKLSQDYDELQIMAGYFIVMFLANGLISSLRAETLPELGFSLPWLAQLGYAFSMLIANLTVIHGFKFLEASIGSIIGTTEILFGILFGALLFSEVLPAGTIVGGLLIILAAILPNLRQLFIVNTNQTSS